MHDSSEVLGICLASLGILILLVGLSFLKALVGVWLWGILAVNIFGLPALSYWEFFGLTILLKILVPRSFIYNNRKDQ